MVPVAGRARALFPGVVVATVGVPPGRVLCLSFLVLPFLARHAARPVVVARAAVWLILLPPRLVPLGLPLALGSAGVDLGSDPPPAVCVTGVMPVRALFGVAPPGAGRPATRLAVGVRRPGPVRTRGRRRLVRVVPSWVRLVAGPPAPRARRRAVLGPLRWPDGPGCRPGHGRPGGGGAVHGGLGRRGPEHDRALARRAALQGRDHPGATAVARRGSAVLPGRGPPARGRRGRGGPGAAAGRLGASSLRRLDLDDARPAPAPDSGQA